MTTMNNLLPENAFAKKIGAHYWKYNFQKPGEFVLWNQYCPILLVLFMPSFVACRYTSRYTMNFPMEQIKNLVIDFLKEYHDIEVDRFLVMEDSSL